MKVDEKRQIQDLAELGLTERESKVYLALVQLGAAGASDIQKMAEVPKSKIYEILQKLIDKGLCLEKSHGYGKKYQAVDPTKALHGLIRKREDELNQMRNKADQTVENLLKIYRDPSKGEPFEFLQVIKNPDQIVKIADEWTRSATKEILQFVKPPFVSRPEVLENEPNVNEMLVKRGVTIKLLCEFVVTSNPILKEGFKREIKNGVEIRFIENLPMKMAMIDTTKVAMCMVDPIMLQPLPTSLFIEHPGLASILKFYFESIWEDAITFSGYVGK